MERTHASCRRTGSGFHKRTAGKRADREGVLHPWLESTFREFPTFADQSMWKEWTCVKIGNLPVDMNFDKLCVQVPQFCNPQVADFVFVIPDVRPSYEGCCGGCAFINFSDPITAWNCVEEAQLTCYSENNGKSRSTRLTTDWSKVQGVLPNLDSFYGRFGTRHAAGDIPMELMPRISRNGEFSLVPCLPVQLLTTGFFDLIDVSHQHTGSLPEAIMPAPRAPDWMPPTPKLQDANDRMSGSMFMCSVGEASTFFEDEVPEFENETCEYQWDMPDMRNGSMTPMLCESTFCEQEEVMQLVSLEAALQERALWLSELYEDGCSGWCGDSVYE